MSGRRRSTFDASESLGRLRLRLTAWYVGTFFAILALLGVGMFAAITRQFDRELDASLRDATRELARVARRATRRAPAPQRRSSIPTRDLRIPGRDLFIARHARRVDVASARSTRGCEELARDAWQRATAGDAIHRRRRRANSSRRTPSAFELAERRGARRDRGRRRNRARGSLRVADRRHSRGGARRARPGRGRRLDPRAQVDRSRSSGRSTHMRRFMADAAHELRTPLDGGASRAEVALQRSRDRRTNTREALAAIERETTRLGRIVEDLLILARADAGERPIERQRVFLDDVALDAAEAARAIADRKARAARGRRLRGGAGARRRRLCCASS